MFTFPGRILENHQREQRERFESQTEGMKLKVEHLQNENTKLQSLFQEKSNITELIREEVSRLSSENSVCYCLDSIFTSKGSQDVCRTPHDLCFPILHLICR